ncbi:MAG: type I glyceraldehyde-3-phosphate dehydrogenase [Chitinophagaceae bacterium]
MRIAINGMGRIGRLLFRRLVLQPEVQIVAVNDIMDTANLAYLLKYDSVYGKLPFTVELDENKLKINGQQIPVYSQPNPEQLPWKELDVDVVLECSGRFTTRDLASKHLVAGAKKVLLSTTGSEDIPLLIYGYNYTVAISETNIISPGGCMTNCSTQLIQLMDNFGIEAVQIHVIHSYTSRQELVDAPHRDFRRGRAAAESIIPVPVDLADSLERLFPLLKNKIATITTRVPVANGAFGDFTFQLKREVNKAEVNEIFKEASLGELRGIVEYTEEPLVSLDIKQNSHSAIVDGSLTTVIGNQVKVFAFFDNEYGYTSRMIDWLKKWQ